VKHRPNERAEGLKDALSVCFWPRTEQPVVQSAENVRGHWAAASENEVVSIIGIIEILGLEA
jgi:hypothetical protein